MIVTDAPVDAIEFRVDRDLIGTKVGIYRGDEQGRRVVWVSQAMYSLMQTDRASVLAGLMVDVAGDVRWILDLFEKGA